jgi:hypothetical protein|tara:strand:+ start:2689 stop:3156 length:468 start_codon:yes stop_codon:yes gene_type:complete
MDIAWIVLTLIFTILILILLFNKKGKNKPNREINFHEKIVINELDKDNTPSLRMSFTNSDVSLKEVITLFKSLELQLNNKGVFEKKINAESSYYVANLNEPGYFKDDQNIKGFTFFYVAKNHIFDRHVSDQMKKDSEIVLNHYSGVYLDNNSRDF